MSSGTLYKIMNSDQPLSSNNTIFSITTPKPPIIRRTLSFDMSTPGPAQIQAQTLKRVQSSDHIQQTVNHHDPPTTNNTTEDKKGAFEDIWNSILSQQKPNGLGSGSGLTPYVHPMVKRTTSSLSEKSLEICTESLGSETGSDGAAFSYPDDDESSEVEEEEEESCVEPESEPEYNYPAVMMMSSKKRLQNNNNNYSSFPPPLPSLANNSDGSNLHMRSHRVNGRLVVEAVTVPSQNCFRAQRHDGRLLLTLATNLETEEDDEEEEEVEEEEEKVMNNVHRSSSLVMMSKIMGLTNCMKNSTTWPRNNFNANISMPKQEVVDHYHEHEKKNVPIVNNNNNNNNNKSSMLPPRPRVARMIPTTAGSANTYEYYWRNTVGVGLLRGVAQEDKRVEYNMRRRNNINNNNINEVGWENFNNNNNIKKKGKLEGGGGMVVVGNKEGGEYLVPFLRGCKDPRRSLLFLERCCIATI